MEEDNKKLTTGNSHYFDELLTRIRNIRASESRAVFKIEDVISTAVDFHGSECIPFFSGILAEMRGIPGATEHLAYKLLLFAEGAAYKHQVLYVSDYKGLVQAFISDTTLNQGIYEHPSYQGIFEDGGEVSLPEELQNFKGGSMVLKIEDMDRLVDTFSSRNTYYRRAYAILADLDKEVIGCVETGVFPTQILIPYKEDGDAIFMFSHFEVDLREPDENYRTLYVVYRYDTTIS